MNSSDDKASWLQTGKLLKKYRAKKRGLLIRSKRVMEFGVRPYLLPGRVRHVHGPEKIAYRPDELLVITVVRNGELYIKSFMDHYRAMGVKHFIILDNASVDSTVELLRAQEAVTVLQTDAPYSKYENTMKRYLAERFSPDRWNLCVDIDELFDYPFSDQLSLRDFLCYLNQNHYTAVVAQMLDLFSDAPLNKIESKPADLLKEKYRYYDISCIEPEDYLWSECSNPAIKFYWGGIRKLVFGTRNGLTKAPLVRMDGNVRPFNNWHHAKGARMADISCLLMHYPFVSSFHGKVQEAARTGRYGVIVTDEYKNYAKRLSSNNSLSLKFHSAQPFTGLDKLIDAGFIVVSDEYRKWVAEYSRQRAGLPVT